MRIDVRLVFRSNPASSQACREAGAVATVIERIEQALEPVNLVYVTTSCGCLGILDERAWDSSAGAWSSAQ